MSRGKFRGKSALEIQQKFLQAAMTDVNAKSDPNALLQAYRKHIYYPLRSWNLKNALLGRNKEPWITVQWLLEYAKGENRCRSQIAREGLIPIAKDSFAEVQSELMALGNGDHKNPLIFVAGYPRSGTSSLQNVVLAAFPDHLPKPAEGKTPLMWWELKHNAQLTESLLSFKHSIVKVGSAPGLVDINL